MFGLAPGCLGPCVYAPAGLLAPMPPHLSFAAAATTPTVYTTVFAAFQQSHSLGPHTRVLVHAGTGGVGLAAVQVASALGCRVLATAGSPAKRAALRCVGVAGTADSRSTAFAYTAAIVGAAGGGIDLLLNSLTSPGGCEVVVGACGCVDPAHGASSVPIKHSAPVTTSLQAWWQPAWPAFRLVAVLLRLASETSGLPPASHKVGCKWLSSLQCCSPWQDGIVLTVRYPAPTHPAASSPPSYRRAA